MTSAFHVYFGPEALTAPPPKVRRIGPEDCFAALTEGFDDFIAMPTYPAFVGLFYGVAGIAIAGFSSLGNACPPHVPARCGLRHHRAVRRDRPL